jgi:glycosyltransferase involved in cell wall biosynthesis
VTRRTRRNVPRTDAIEMSDAAAGWSGQVLPMTTQQSRRTVTIVITTYNHARFLSEAIASAIRQEHPADNIIVVDDGSTDGAGEVVTQFEGVEYVRQENGGLSSARNTGLSKCTTDYVTFLDADDRLLPCAVAAGRACVGANPECALAYGGHRVISENGSPIGGARGRPIIGNAHLSFLRGNIIGMHGAVLYRRDVLLSIGGFDESVRRCEDYDVFLRLAYRHPVACHHTLVAEYRKHGQNMSSNAMEMLYWANVVLDRHQGRISMGPSERRALQAGRAGWLNYYGEEAWNAAMTRYRTKPSIPDFCKELLLIGWWSQRLLTRRLLQSVVVRAKNALPAAGVERMERLPFLRSHFLPIGAVRFGDLRRLSPINGNFGYERGTPIDRYYIEAFLCACAGDVRGCVLEVGDNTYTVRFGGSKVEMSGVLHVDPDNREADYVGDLSRAGTLPSERFDCIVLTQTLHLIYDMRAAITNLHRALKPGGVLILTTPGITPIDAGEWGYTWYWALTPVSARQLLEEHSQRESIAVQTSGNVFAAICFLQGIAMEEITPAELEANDACYPVVITCRAVKARSAAG